MTTPTLLITPEEFETFVASARKHGVLGGAVRPPSGRGAMCYLGHMYYVKTGELPDIDQRIKPTQEGIYGDQSLIPPMGRTSYGHSDRYVYQHGVAAPHRYGHCSLLEADQVDGWVQHLIDRGVIAIIEGDES